LEGDTALATVVGFFQGKRDFRFDVEPAHGKAGPRTGTTAAAEKRLKEIAEPAAPATAAKYVTKVLVGGVRPLPTWRWCEV
jgi:hypothetical protein